jgi:quercetin dioxygenase-like cupin family protein
MIDLSKLELIEAWSAADPDQRLRFTFPISGETGSATSVAYVELPPGRATPMHYDSANEIDLVLDGAVEWEMDGERTTYGPGTLVEIAAEKKHCLRNVGEGAARVVSYLDTPDDVVTFDEPFMPMDTKVLGAEPAS